jgi:DNA-binding winged helix-turn-helix (wHTH) protein
VRERRPQIYEFDDFRLDVGNRRLLRDGRPVELASKAFDMLVALVESGGRLVEKDELFSRVWPEQVVEESNLAVHVSAIRKALGDSRQNPHYVFTVPGHGYRFAGDVLRVDEEEEELVVERHSVSRLTVETEREATGNGGSTVETRAPSGGTLTIDEVKTVNDLPRARPAPSDTHLWHKATRPKLNLAGIALLAFSTAIFFFGIRYVWLKLTA